MKKTILLFFLFAGAAPIMAQTDSEVLARTGKSVITQSEFQERFELTPWPRPPVKVTSENLKQGFLYTLIAEKLWALKAQAMGLDTTKAIRMAFNTLEKMYVRDALWKLEIKDKVNIPDDEYAKGYLRLRFLYNTEYLISGSEKEISSLYDMLNKGASFDSLMIARGRKGKDTLGVSYGMMEEAVEDEIYNLMIGQYTSPAFTPNGWCIFRLNAITQLGQDPKDQQKVNELVKKIATERATARVYQKFYRSFFMNRKVNVDRNLFSRFADRVSALLKEKKDTQKISDSDIVFLQPPDLLKTEDQFGPDTLRMSFVKFDHNPVTMKQFIEEFSMEGFSSQNIEPRYIKSVLNTVTKKYIENEMLTREGYKRGLQNLPEVKRSLNMWKENYLSQLLRSEFKDSASVNDEEALKYYQQMQQHPVLKEQVNIVEVLTDSLDIAEKVLDALKNGADMHELAKKYSKREAARDSNGESGFFPVTENGEIGRIASAMALGDVYGPLQVPGGYSIFKLIGRKEDSTRVSQSFQEMKETIKKELSSRKLFNSVVNYTVRLANNYGISINQKALTATEVINVPMFTYRFMGFGGKLPAVPMTAPFVEWVGPWLESRSSLP